MHKGVEAKTESDGIYYLFTLVILVLFYFFVWPQVWDVKERMEFINNFVAEKARIETDIALYAPQYQEKIKSAEKVKAENESKYEKILPSKDQIRKLTNDIENFINQKNSRDIKLKLLSLSFGDVNHGSGQGYSTASISATVEANQRGLLNFLKFIEESGDLDGKSDMDQLLSLSSLEIPVQSVNNNSVNSFNFNIKAYYAPQGVFNKASHEQSS